MIFLSRTGPPDATVCTNGEDMNFAVRDKSLASTSSAHDIRTTLSSTKWGNFGVNAAAIPPPCCASEHVRDAPKNELRGTS